MKQYLLIVDSTDEKPVGSIHATKDAAKAAAATHAGSALDWKKATSTNAVWARTYDGTTYRITEHDVAAGAAPQAAAGSVNVQPVLDALDAVKAAVSALKG